MTVDSGEKLITTGGLVNGGFRPESFYDSTHPTNQAATALSTSETISEGTPQTETVHSGDVLVEPSDVSGNVTPQAESTDTKPAPSTAEAGWFTRRRNKVVAAVGAAAAVAALTFGLSELNGSSGEHQPKVSVASELRQQSRHNPKAFILTWLKAALKGDVRDTEPYVGPDLRKLATSPNGTYNWGAIVSDFDGKYVAADQHPEIANPAALANFNPATAALYTGPVVNIKGMVSLDKSRTIPVGLGADRGHAEIEEFPYNLAA